MTAPREIALEALEARRARLAALADELSDQIDRMPTPELHRRLEGVAATIDSLDRMLDARRREP